MGALCYLPDLDRWAGVVAELLSPGGRLYVVEFHPLLNSRHGAATGEAARAGRRDARRRAVLWGRRARRADRRWVPVRWLTLYARSRQVPASLAAVVISTVTVWAFARGGSGGPGDPRLPALALAAGAMALSTGLSGQDLALDRTAAIRWAPRRAVHVPSLSRARSRR
ncbi:hypothetical protein SVIO_004590 [Streptomyces violaceusniger]|uniref:Uncharacterized protein n=1 Tax=Streptomyces violaceusniger TaxID=68280 RepID=A0A4D4KSH9_STRVO|nr:hypothetical protein SVIO_004590 [Streptomyces violaceusniger]